MNERFNQEKEPYDEPQAHQLNRETLNTDQASDPVYQKTNPEIRPAHAQSYPAPEASQDSELNRPVERSASRSGSAQVFQMDRDDQTITTQNIKGMSVVSIQDGEKIGSVSDIIIDADKLEVAALVLSKGTLWSREVQMVPAQEVQVWGRDVILVRRHKVVNQQISHPEGQRWLYADEHIRGRYVVSVNGKRIGQISDVTISQAGKLLSYQLSQVFIDGPLSESKTIDVNATHSLGEDVLIVNSVENL
jgi:uncharacterized protein YrrD